MGGAGTIPIAFPGSDVTALRPPYIPNESDQNAVPNPGTNSLPSFLHVSIERRQ